MQDKPVALVNGVNKGSGLQIAKDLAAHGLTVLHLRLLPLTASQHRKRLAQEA